VDAVAFVALVPLIVVGSYIDTALAKPMSPQLCITAVIIIQVN